MPLVPVITRTMYLKALEIFLKWAYPTSEFAATKDRKRRIVISELDKDPKNVPLREVRVGCYENPHMKMCYSKGFALKKPGFFVYKNDLPDTKETQESCEVIKNLIENDWEAQGIPVLGR